MEGGVKIREAEDTDVDAIVDLLADDPIGKAREQPGDPVYRRAFAEMRTQRGNMLLVAERGAKAPCAFTNGVAFRRRMPG